MEISTEIFSAVPSVFGVGLGLSALVVVAASLVVSCFKALIKMVGR